VVYTSRLSSDYPISLPAIDILRSRVALTVIPLLTFKLRHGKGQNWHNAAIPFRVYDLGLTNIASSMSQIAVVILNWIIQSVFQRITHVLLSRYHSVVCLEQLSNTIRIMVLHIYA
jgi:hypothetical protein